MTRRHTLYTILAALHLALVACGAAGWKPLAMKTTAGHALEVVCSYTGANTSYGFFAPGVSNTVRPTFKLIDANGKTWTDTLDNNMGREAQLRVGSGFGMTAELRPEELQLMLQSWAATMLGRHPNAKTVIVAITIYELPTMDEYRAGKRPEWTQVFPPLDEPELADFAVFHRK